MADVFKKVDEFRMSKDTVVTSVYCHKELEQQMKALISQRDFVNIQIAELNDLIAKCVELGVNG